MWSVALGAVAAIFRALGEAIKVWHLRQAKQAGRVEAERDALAAELETTRRGHAIDAEIRRDSPDELERRLRDGAGRQ